MSRWENAPCYVCQNRTDDCHSKCERYITWSKERKEKVMAAFKAKEPHRIMHEYLVDKIIRNKRKNRK